MHPRFLGDSYDIVKQSLLRWLGSIGPWSVHLMYAEAPTSGDVEAFEYLLGRRLFPARCSVPIRIGEHTSRRPENARHPCSSILTPASVLRSSRDVKRRPISSPMNLWRFPTGGLTYLLWSLIKALRAARNASSWTRSCLPDAITPDDHWLTEADVQVLEESLARSLPHRSLVERHQIAEGFLGVTTWQRLCSAFGLGWPPSRDEQPGRSVTP